MKTRKIIAALLVFCLLCCEFPAGVMTAFAAGPQISYSRMDPEVVILNAYTGNDSDFYAKVQSDPDYNFAERISSLGYKKTISDDTSVSYANFGNTVLSKLSNRFYNQMEASYSATFNNKNGHTHAMGLITIDTSYISSAMYINGGTVATPSGLGGISSKTTRQGNNKFKNYYSGSGNLQIQYLNSKRIYTVLTGKEYNCNCGGDVYNHTILFRDQVAPFVMETDILDASGNAASEFKVGDKVVIKVTCSEPLRFAGDAADAKKDICIGLQVDGGGQGDQLIARMTSLKTNENSVYYNATNVSEMCFEYTVPDTMEGKVLSIIGLDFAPTALTAGQVALRDNSGKIPLVQVCGDRSVAPVANKGIGYNTTTSYVTDLAGNALKDAAAKCSFYIDSEAPYAAEITASAVTKNASVKEALGKSGMDPQDPTYADASDSNLGVGDEITFNVYMNELITPNLGDVRKYSCVYNGAKLTTNLLDAGGNPVTVTSSFAFNTASESSQYGKGSSAGRVTMLSFDPLTIAGNMHTSDGAAEIRVTKLEFTSDVKDNAVNAYDGSADKLTVAQKYKLDVKAPEITQGSARPATYGGKAYVYQFTVSDEAGVTGLNGTFSWNSGGRTVPYEYALTANADEPSKWSSASMYRDIPFTQTGAPQYLHIRPINGQQYDIHSSSISFGLNDYAGNRGYFTVNLGDGIVFDTVAPDVAAGSVSRNFDSGTNTGTMTVTVNITDAGAALKEPVADVDRPMYIWATSGAAITAGSGSWKPLGGVIDGANIAFTLTAEVGNRSCFEKDLYVKAGDSFGNNTGAVKVGTYTYNLTSVKYDLSYSSAVTTAADIKVNALDSGGFLFFYIPTGNANEYYGRCMTAASPGNIFSSSSSWSKYILTESGGDMFFTKTGDVGEWPYDPSKHDFTGIVDVAVVSGYAESVSNTDGTLTISGSEKPYGTERFKLYVVKSITNSYTPIGSGENEHDYTSVFDDVLDVSLTNTSGAVLDRTYSYWYYWDSNGEYVMESPAGLPFTVSITPKDGYDWVLDDIDLSGSKILVYRGYGNTSVYEHIGEIPLSNSFTQTIYLPELDYGKGEIHLQLLLRRNDGARYPYYSNANCIISLFADNSPASDDFELTNVIHTYDVHSASSTSFGLEPGEFITDLPVDKSPYVPESGAELSPMTVPFYYYPGSSINDPEWNSEVYLAVSSNETRETTSFGAYVCCTGSWLLKAWNLTSGSDKVTLDQYYLGDKNEVYTEEDGNIALNFKPLDDLTGGNAHGGRLQLMPANDAADAKAADTAGKLGVIKNTVNVIAIQRINQNGNVSAVKYYAIYPMEETVYPQLTPYVDGVDVSDSDCALGREVSYEAAFAGPDEVELYVFNAVGRKAFTPEASGIYSYTADPTEGTASVFMKDSNGIAVPLKLYNRYRTDYRAPVVSGTSGLTVAGDGSFTASFEVMDDSFRPELGGGLFAPALHLGFDEEYSLVLGVLPVGALDIDLISYPSIEGGNKYFWTTDGTDKTGIAEVYAELDGDGVLAVDVRGFISPKVSDSAPMDISLYVAASDIFGNRSEALTTTADGAYGAEPQFTYADFTGNSYAGMPDKTLNLNFNAPVQPAESWINRDIEGFSYSWWDAFPITKDGEWDITFTDIFGITYDQTIKIPESENSFGSDGFDLYISTLEPTGGDVTISAATDDGMDWFIIGTMSADGKISWPAVVPTPSVTMNASENGCYVVLRLDNNHNGEPVTDAFDFRDCTFIHLNNVAKAAPEAELSFYFEEFGDSFTPEELRSRFPGGVTTGDFVRVSYDTARHVTASGETEHVFAYGGATSCSFSYTDDFGHAGGAKVDLADYGITLAAPPEPYKDEEVPLVSVDIYAKRSGAYVPSEFFSAGDSPERVSEAFADASFVQDYSLSLGVQDYSSCRILLLSSEPTSLSYSSESDYSNASVTLSGNSIHISKEFRTDGTDFWVAVVDNAVEETGAPADNFTGFMVRKDELAGWFDNVKPEVTETKEIAESLYQHTLYLKLDDKADDGRSTPSDSLSISGTAVRRNEKTTGNYSRDNFPYCITFNSNSDIPVTIMDAAGNYILSMMRPLTEIDDSEPVLNIEWSPGLSTEAGIDPTQPTDGPVNTEITAHIYSDKPIDISPAATKLEYLDGGDYHPLSGSESNNKKISWDATAQRVTVTFAGEESCGQQLRATVYAPNGRFAQAYLQVPGGAIDKEAPGWDLDISPLRRSSASTVPYGLEYTLQPDELVYIDGVLYNRYWPYSIELIGKSKKDITLTDLAGNISVCTLNTETDYAVPADNTAPVISFVDPASGDLSELNASGGTVTATVVSDENCTLLYPDGRRQTVTAGANVTLSFTSNGTRTLRFTDDAGNESSLTLTVSTIDKIIPVITMSSTTVSLIQGSSPEELEAALNSGVTASDNSGNVTLTHDSSAVKLGVPGNYIVVYTAKDGSGNKATARRTVKVISKDLPQARIDGQLLESGGVMSIAPGRHILTVSNLRESGEPYKLVFVRGIYYDGQMKYLNSQVTVGSDGSFTVDTEGFYTFYLQTQSRQSLRCLIDVEK